MPSPLISFIIPTRRPQNLSGFFDNIERSAVNPSCVEVLIKFDNDQPGIAEFIEEEKGRRPFAVKYVISPRLEGTFSLWIGMEQLFFMTDPDSYFIMVMSDEPRFLTQGWDKILRDKYMGYYPDDMFRLRISVMKLANYASHYECTFKPDSFPIYTRRWLELTEGTGDCWGSDAYQQCVAYHLWLGPKSYYNYYREGSIYRDVPVFDIEFGGLEFGVGVSVEDQRERHRRNLKEWRRLTTHHKQEEFSYLARRIYAYLWACEHRIDDFRIIRNPVRKSVSLRDARGEELLEVSYAVPRLVVYSQNALRYIHLFFRHATWELRSRRLFTFPFRLLRGAAISGIEFALWLRHDVLRWLFGLFRQPRIAVGIVLLRLQMGITTLVTHLMVEIYKLSPQALRPFMKQASQRIGSINMQLQRRLARLAGKRIASPSYPRHGLRWKARHLYRKLQISLSLPFHVTFWVIDKMLVMPPPGVAVLVSRKVKLPPRVKPPTEEDLRAAREILTERERQQKALRGKHFHITREAYKEAKHQHIIAG